MKKFLTKVFGKKQARITKLLTEFLNKEAEAEILALSEIQDESKDTENQKDFSRDEINTLHNMQGRFIHVEQRTDQAKSDAEDMTAEAEKPRQFSETTDDETFFRIILIKSQEVDAICAAIGNCSHRNDAKLKNEALNGSSLEHLETNDAKIDDAATTMRSSIR